MLWLGLWVNPYRLTSPEEDILLANITRFLVGVLLVALSADKTASASHIHVTYVCKVFTHLEMLWMVGIWVIWVHPQANIPLEVGNLVAKMGFW